ncbi:MAG: glycosyltransferase family 4 protein [bacterium]
MNSYFLDNKLYQHLYKSLSNYNRQIVYVPIKFNRKSEKLDYNIKNFNIIYSKIIKKYHKIFYFHKIKILYNDLKNKITLHKIDIVHAHNLFIDGALAYKINKLYGIDYIVNIRLTDIELQYKYMWHRRKLAHKVLNNAKKIIFVSEISKVKFINLLDKNISRTIQPKITVIPNGIVEFWHNNKYYRKASLTSPVKLLFVGRIIKLKNLDNVIKAVNLLNDTRHEKYELTVIGGKHPGEEKYFNKLQKLFDNKHIFYKGKINSLDNLLIEYRNHDIFVMPSKKELFGIAYIEALSQSLPVIYSNNQGLDKMFNEGEVGYGCEANNPKDIADKIISVKHHYKFITSKCVDAVNSFDWDIITKEYNKIYQL